MYSFELGPIRPPSEAMSILLRLTRSCHWNKCTFCPVYKRRKFSMRKVDEIKKDIDAMYAIAQMLYKKIGMIKNSPREGEKRIERMTPGSGRVIPSRPLDAPLKKASFVN